MVSSPSPPLLRETLLFTSPLLRETLPFTSPLLTETLLFAAFLQPKLNMWLGWHLQSQEVAYRVS